MVARVRELAEETASREQAELILIDGSPGIGCPVIASIGGTDLVLIVTEPTLSGIHDLERVIALAEHFGIGCASIINKFDINLDNTQIIIDLCTRRAIPTLGKIPHDSVFTRAMVAGLPVVEFEKQGVSNILKDIWEKVRRLLELKTLHHTYTRV
jgi:MinD superfamily P-loop ATPase